MRNLLIVAGIVGVWVKTSQCHNITNIDFELPINELLIIRK
jgi:hypothetical protein